MKINLKNKILDKFLKGKDKDLVFVCQITENLIKVIKCRRANKSGGKFLGLESELISPDIDDKKLTEILSRFFKKLGYNNNPVIISLPRSKATCRYLKVPAQEPKEIEKIVALQASRYLPYASNELIAGYQVIEIDKEGYAGVNLVIVHRDVIGRYLNIFRELKVQSPTTALSSYGLINLYDYLNPQEPATVMVVDIDSFQSEFVVCAQKKNLFSRTFKIDKLQANWEGLFVNEIKKSQDAYLKEVTKDAPQKIIFMGVPRICQELTPLLKKEMGLPVEALSYEKVNLGEDLLNRILISESSFASLIGFALGGVEESLNLLPTEIKETVRFSARQKEWLRIALYIFGIILIFGLGVARNLSNKANYRDKLKLELNKIAKEAKPLEDIEKKMHLVSGRLQQKPTTLDVLSELNRLMPEQVSLATFSYEEGKQIILRGQAPQLDSVFTFVGQLQKSTLLKKFNIKVRYATKRNTPSGEIVDFEIACIQG